MGWERKRGKLHELNRLLRGATDTSFVPVGGRPPVSLPGVRYVITLDADTRLPREAARRLVGKMAHPLNRPRFDSASGRVVEGHAVLQPRVTPSLPMGREESLFQRIASSAPGLDPYAAAVSDQIDIPRLEHQSLPNGSQVRMAFACKQAFNSIGLRLRFPGLVTLREEPTAIGLPALISFGVQFLRDS
jgi:hypothetical protein